MFWMVMLGLGAASFGLLWAALEIVNGLGGGAS